MSSGTQPVLKTECSKPVLRLQSVFDSHSNPVGYLILALLLMLGQVLFSFELFMTLVTCVVITAKLMLPLEVQPDVVFVPGAVQTQFAGVGTLGAWG